MEGHPGKIERLIDSIGKVITAVIALVVIVFSFSLFYLILFKASIPQESKDIVIYILGVLSAVITQIVSYFFGSSKDTHETLKNSQRRG